MIFQRFIKVMCTIFFLILQTAMWAGDKQMDTHDLSGCVDSLRALESGIENFEKLTTLAEKEGINTNMERATLVTAEHFLNYLQWEIENMDSLSMIVGMWKKFQNDSLRIERAVLQHVWNEINSTREILIEATTQLNNLRLNPGLRRSLQNSSYGIQIENGYFTDGQRPVFPGGANFATNDPSLNIGGIGKAEDARYLGFRIVPYVISLARIYAKDGSINPNFINQMIKKLDMYKKQGFYVNIFIGNDLPRWIVEKYPDITASSGHFVRYDIDHPAVKKLWTKAFAAVIPAIEGHPGILAYLLANEPFWHEDNPSLYTLKHYRNWLKQKYGTIAEVNLCWNTEFADFENIRFRPENNKKAAEWYDWCRFNQDRCTAWFKFLNDEIKKYAPQALTHIKLSENPTFMGSIRYSPKPDMISTHSWGIDREALSEITDINGCDTRILPCPPFRVRSPWYDFKNYALHWIQQSLAYDFMKSVAPDKPIFDSEWHSVTTDAARFAEIPGKYMSSILWMAHLHGLAANQIWYWGRSDAEPLTRNMDPVTMSWFYASFAAHPHMVNSYARTLLQLNTFSPEITALASAPKPIRLLYSESSVIQNVSCMDAMLAAYEALYFLGVPVGFVTEKMLNDLPDDCEWIVVPQTTHTENKTVEILEKFHKAGVKITLIGDDNFKYTPEGKIRKDQLDWIESMEKVEPDSVKIMFERFEKLFQNSNIQTPVRCVDLSGKAAFGVECRSVRWRQNDLIFLVNLNSSPVTVRIQTTDQKEQCVNLIENRQETLSAINLEAMGFILLRIE